MGWFRDLFQPPASEPTDAKAATGTQEFVKTIQEGWWTDAYGSMYRNQPAVRAAVDWLGRNIAQLNPKVFERVSNDDRLELGAHPLAALLRSPNPLTSRYSLLRDTVSDLAVFDRAVWVKGYNRGRLVTVDRRPPSQMTAKQVNGVTVWHGPAGQTYTRKQLVLFHGYSPDGDESGVSPMETLRRVLNEDKAALEHRANMWRNSARQSGWVERPAEAPRWSDEARTRFRHDLESTLSGGANAGRIGILEEGMRWNGNSFSPKDTEYLAGRHLTYEEVCIAFGLKASLLGLGNDTASSS